MHLRIQYSNADPFSSFSLACCCAQFKSTRNVIIIALSKDPRQMDPNDVVHDRYNDDVTVVEQHPCGLSLLKHHVAMEPATLL
jgi:hypothetical protein